MTLVKNKTHGIDVDKLDYIPRDNLAFGLALNVDVSRIIRNTMVIEDELCFCERIKDELFNLFFVRYRLHREVYSHPKVLALDLSVQDIIRATCREFSTSWTDMTVLSQCPDQELAKAFTEGQGQWRHVCDNGNESMVMVKVRPSFCSEGVEQHPLSRVRVYSRRAPSSSLRYLALSEYNVFACGPFTEELSYTFTKTALY